MTSGVFGRTKGIGVGSTWKAFETFFYQKSLMWCGATEKRYSYAVVKLN